MSCAVAADGSSARSECSEAVRSTTSGGNRRAVSGASLRNIAAVRGLNSEETPARIHAAASILRWFRDTRGDKPRSTNASHAHLIASASAMEASVDSFGAIMSKSAWTCSRGRPPPPPPLLAPTVPPSLGPGAEERNVIPTQDARSVVASSAAACRTSDERRSRRNTTSAPDRDSNLCPSPPACERIASPSIAQVTARDDSGLAPCRLNVARSVVNIRSAAAASTAEGAPRSVAAARSLSLAPALPSDVSRSTTLSCSAPPVSTARRTSSSASSPPFGGKKPLDKTSAADGRSAGSGARSAAMSVVCCGYFDRKSGGRRSLPLWPAGGRADRSWLSSTARSIPVENLLSISKNTIPAE